MYSSFYGFSEKPFDVTPDPKYFYSSPSHREMLASLLYGIKERRGFICFTGEVGTGKTMLIHAALDRLDENTKVAYIANTSLNFMQLLLVTLEELGIVEPGNRISKLKAIRLLNEFTIRQLSKEGNVVLIIDEAHNLDPDSMENLRLLSNLETRKHKLIQIVLSGQPELDAKLGRPELRQLAQRISVRRTIQPLTEKEAYSYIQHRLNIAGYTGADLFRNKARKMIYEYSWGIPRRINILCDNALLIGYALKKREIDADCVTEAAHDLRWESVVKGIEPAFSTGAAQTPQLAHKRLSPRKALAGSIALAAGLIVAAWITFGRSGSTLSVAPPSLSESAVQAEINTGQQNVGQPAPEPVLTPTTRADLPINNAIMEKAKSTSGKTVVVKQNDNLTGIIQRAYGRYKDSTLEKVLKENPQIRNPDFIVVGQVIRLPELEPTELND